MNNYKKIWRLFVVLQLLTVGAAAQYRFESWTTEEGLPYKEARAVRQTRDGYVWATTADGLARFDGVKFTVFNTGNTAGMVTNRVGKLAETADGSLWIGTDERGLMRYRDGVFVNYTTADGLPDDSIQVLFADATGDYLIVVTQTGAVRRRNEKFERIGGAENAQRIPVVDNTGALWFKRDNRIHRLSEHGGDEVFGDALNASDAYQIVTAFQDRAGDFWVSVGDIFNAQTEDVLYRFGGGEKTVYTPRNGLPKATIYNFLESDDGSLWLGSWGGGLTLFRDGKFRVFTSKDGLCGDIISSLTNDREGGIWLSCVDGGLTRFSRQIVSSISTKDGLAGDNVYPLYEDADGAVLIGTWEGLDRYDNGVITHFAAPPDLPTKYITSIFRDRDDTLWIGTFGGYAKFKNGVFERFRGEEGIPTTVIRRDRNGVLWLGTSHGLRKFVDGNFADVQLTNDSPPPEIRVLHEDRNGVLWIGTNVGLARIENGATQFFTEKTGLSGSYIRSIYEDADGALWFGTFDKGITRLKDGKLTIYRVENGLFDEGAFCILEDSLGWFWISSNRGIYRVSRADLNDFAAGKIASVTSVAYGVKDGMLDAECNGGVQFAGIKTRDGRLWFPTQKGAAIINPASLPPDSAAPPVVIESVTLDRKTVSIKDTIEITPDNDALEINFTGLGFDQPEQIRFRYKLEGSDKNWTDAGTRRTAYFTICYVVGRLWRQKQ